MFAWKDLLFESQQNKKRISLDIFVYETSDRYERHPVWQT